MTRHLLGLALLLSLLFNVFFAVGYFQARREAGVADSPARLRERVVDELGLTPEQAKAFADMRREVDQEVEHLTEGLALFDQQLLAELRSPTPDEARIGEIMAQRDDLRRRRHGVYSERFREFVQLLDPEQRERLTSRMRGSPRHGMGRRLMMLHRFDRNGNGRLDPEEEQEAREHFRSDEQRRDEMRREMMRRFDADGDGQLDPDEERAMREWRRQQGPPERWPRERNGHRDRDRDRRSRDGG